MLDEWPPERLFDDADRDIARKGRHPVLQDSSSCATSTPTTSGRVAKGLSELDIGGAELAMAVASRATPPPRRATNPAKSSATRTSGGKAGGVDAGKHAFARKNKPGAAEPNNMADGCRHERTPDLL